MVERSYSLTMEGEEPTDLRVALYEQKEVVRKLREELDAEREASASSASEAMAMMLRLQGEKASLAMEASQYKRMVEERMSQAEMSLAVLEDIIYQKELEINALGYQVQAYRCKLVGSEEAVDSSWKMEIPSIFVQKDDIFGKKRAMSRDRSQTPSPEPVEKGVIEQSMDSRRSSSNYLSFQGDLESYWEQIKKLDDRVKEITIFRDSLRDQYKMQKLYSMKSTKHDLASCSNVQDVFQVARTKEKKQTKLERKSSKQQKDRANVVEYQTELKQLRERIDRLELERNTSTTSISQAQEEDEEAAADVLREIKEKLIFVQSEIENLRRIKKKHSRDDPSLVPLQEAMLYFWL